MAKRAAEAWAPAGSSRACRLTLSFLQELLADFHPRDFRVRLWDGATWEPEPGVDPRFTLVLNHPGALRALLLPPTEKTMTEAYLDDDVDVEGNLEAVLPLGDHLLVDKHWGPGERLRSALTLLTLPAKPRARAAPLRARLRGRRHTTQRDADATNYHYNLSNEFFALFLDSRMVYSCAYFERPDESLDVAQERKLDYLCRKLRLRPGERVLDIGCGWGPFLVYAAERYGVEVVGITVSERQAEYVRDLLSRSGLEGKCRIEVCDYRELNDPEGFDKLVSVGMVEHLPDSVLPAYFRSAWQLLRPGGVFLNHGVVRANDHPARRGAGFVHRYVFPDSRLVTISTRLRIAEEVGFEPRDLESFRDHYVLTTRRWLERLEARCDEARRLVGDVGYRIFRLYLAGSAYGLATGRVNVQQLILLKPDRGRSGLPLTRDDWYGAPRRVEGAPVSEDREPVRAANPVLTQGTVANGGLVVRAR